MKVKRIVGAGFKASDWPYTVTGPGHGKKCPSYGAACAFALDHASRSGDTFYIREYDEVIARAEHTELGAVLIVQAAA
jgi:hypothetical protein